MPDFLESITFISSEQRAALRADDLDTAAAFAHVTVAMLQAPPFGLTIGKASRLLAAAHGDSSALPAPSTMVVNIAEPPDLRTRIERALAAAEVDHGAVGALADLGVERVVLGVDGKVDAAATLAMRAHASTGAPIGQTWQGARIASARSLSTPTVWCSPRTSRPLQGGKDEVTGTEWATLGLDRLRIAAFGYEQEMFVGMTEAAVLEEIKGKGEMFSRVERRMVALGVKPEDMDRAVVFGARKEPDAAHPLRRDGAPRPPSALRGGQLTGGTMIANLSGLLLSMFSADEIRRFFRYQPNGSDFAAGLPGSTASPAAVAQAAADMLIRHGMLTRSLRDALVAERPRRADQIDAVFSAAGVL